MDPLLLPWVVEIGLISYRDMTQGNASQGDKPEKRPPLPSELAATFVVFGAFTLVSAANPRLGGLLGWGIVLATGLQVFGKINSSTVAKATGSNSSGAAKAVTGTAANGVGS
jgi:hypothetical protein